MADRYQLLLGGVAVAVMVLVPIFCVIGYDLLAGRWDNSVQRWKMHRMTTAEHRRGVRALRRQVGVPIEQVAADLRRLRGLVRTDANSSAAHQLGNRLAYDRILMQACEMLEVEHELGQQTAGMERDIERLRIEAELERAGLAVTDRRYGQAA